MNVAFVGNPADAWYQSKVLQALGRSKITFTFLSVAAWFVGDGPAAFGFSSSFHISVCSQRFVAVIVVV